MADLAFILLLSGFFGLCVAYIRGLDRMLQSNEESPGTAEGSEPAVGGNR